MEDLLSIEDFAWMEDLASRDFWELLSSKLEKLSHGSQEQSSNGMSFGGNLDVPSWNSPQPRTKELMEILNETFDTVSDNLDLYALGALPQDQADEFLTYAAVLARLRAARKHPVLNAAFFDDWSAEEFGDILNAGADVNECDEDGESVLKKAVDACNIEKVKLLLNHKNLKIDPVDSQLWTPLHDACQLGPVEMVELLCDVGHANIEARNDEGFTPLQVAAFHGKADIIRSLLARKSNAAAIGKDNITALHRATFNNHPEAVDALIRGGADCNFRGLRGLMPLHAAAEAADPSVVRMLLNAGADVNARRDDGITPLGVAVYRGSEPIVLMLLQRGATGCSMALFSRALSESPDVALLLLDAHHDVGLREKLGGDESASEVPPLLMRALGAFEGDAKRDEEMALALTTALLRRGAQCDTPSPATGATPLHVAAARGWARITKLLLEQPNISVDRYGGNLGVTPLWLAASSGNIEIIQGLLHAGAKVDAPSVKHGSTPLMEAAWAGEGQAAKVLVASGASCRQKNLDELNAIEIAAKAGQDSLSAFLAQEAAKEDAKRRNEEQATSSVSGVWLEMEALAEKELPDSSGTRNPGWLKKLTLEGRRKAISVKVGPDKPLQETYKEQELPSLFD
ncbi:hypothetical protein NW759_010400 [Fusarium solani]|nr:hypothetical protein NW759_010400 [Fusarium solani]